MNFDQERRLAGRQSCQAAMRRSTDTFLPNEKLGRNLPPHFREYLVPD